MGPDFTAVGGTGIQAVIGALLTIVLIAAVATLIVGGIGWAVGTGTGNWQLAAKGRVGVLVALGAGAAAGAGIAWANWLIHLGARL